MGFVIAAAVAFVALGVVITLELRLNRRNRPIWDKEEAEPIRFSTAVLLKREPALRWALGARGSTLIVRSKAFSVAGPGESVSWHFNAPDSTIEWVQSRIGFRAKQEWIAIEGTDVATDKQVRLSISPTDIDRLWDTWSALVSEGIVPLSDPPL
jgi:hypothetical protein